MSAGLAALLDDVAVLARAAAASVDDVAAGAGRASVKAAGVIVDDAAVTPRYVQGFRPERELPMIKRIAVGSLRNKLLLHPARRAAAQRAAAVAAHADPDDRRRLPLLRGRGEAVGAGQPAPRRTRRRRSASRDREHEDALVGGAIRTDFILSAEIMVISLNEVADEPLALARADPRRSSRSRSPPVVYGVVGADREDGRRRPAAGADPRRARPRRSGAGSCAAMPVVLSVLSKVGIAAMLWVGGHILLVGLDELGVSAPYDAVHHLEEDVDDALGAVGGVGAWLTNTAASAILGLVVGAIVVAVMHLRGRTGRH